MFGVDIYIYIYIYIYMHMYIFEEIHVIHLYSYLNKYFLNVIYKCTRYILVMLTKFQLWRQLIDLTALVHIKNTIYFRLWKLSPHLGNLPVGSFYLWVAQSECVYVYVCVYDIVYVCTCIIFCICIYGLTTLCVCDINKYDRVHYLLMMIKPLLWHPK